MTRGNNDGLLALLIVFCAAVAIVVLYLLSKALLLIGILACLSGFVIFIIGLCNGSGSAAIVGGALLIGGIFVGLIGYEGVSFFENDPTGQNLLDSSGKIIDAGSDTAQAIAGSYKSEAAIGNAIQNTILESMNQTG